jgi:hypothetical protein
MDPPSPFKWFLKCGLATALALSVYAAISLAGPKAPPLPTSRDGAEMSLDRYMTGPVPSVLLAGSSFTARLNEEYFDTPDLEVLGLAGGSAITALEVALARDRLPKTILIELNVLTRGEDRALVEKFSGNSTPAWPRPIRSAIAFYERWHHPLPDRSRARALAAALLKGAPSNFDNHFYVERAMHAWRTAPTEGIMAGDLAALKELVEKIKARGSRVYFYILPVAGPLQDSVAAKATALAAHAAFPDDRPWVHLDGSLPDLRWADGVHLDERSAILIAQQIDGFLNGIRAGTQ